MTPFKPATPQIVPAPGPAADATTVPSPVEAAPPAPGAVSVGPPTGKHVPHYGAPTRIVTSRTLVGAPSTSPPPHLSPPQPTKLPEAKREYAWQKNRALGKRF